MCQRWHARFSNGFRSSDFLPSADTQHRRSAINWDTIKGDWKQLKGKIREQWGDFTEDELDKSKEEVQTLLKKFEEKIDEMADKKSKEIMEQ